MVKSKSNFSKAKKLKLIGAKWSQEESRISVQDEESEAEIFGILAWFCTRDLHVDNVDPTRSGV